MRKLKSDQSGMVSIVVSMILIMVLSLIVLAFARLTQREQRQVLDRQLNAEAFYAAESGINDAARALREGGPERTEENDNCDAPDGGYDNRLDGTNIMYTCLLIDPSPTSLEYNNITRGESKVFPVELRSGSTNAVSFYWQQPDVAPSFTGSCPGATLNSFPATWPPTGTGCSTGVLRIDLVRIDNSFNRDELRNSVATIFAVPRSGGAAGSVAFSTVSGPAGSPVGRNQGQIVASGCVGTQSPTHPKHCEVRITGLTLNASQMYYARVVPLYLDAEVSVCAPECNSGALELINAQAQVDSTGRAADVLRRIQVRIGLSIIQGQFPVGAIESNTGLCKRISVAPPDTAPDDCAPLGAATPYSSGGPGAAAAIATCAELGTCPASSGGPSSSTARWKYNVTLVNNSNNPGLTITGCDWEWGDGTHDLNVSCAQGQNRTHCYQPYTPYPPYTPDNQKTFVAKLTINFSDGSSATSTPRNVSRPYQQYTDNTGCSILKPV
jgi:hypothetical protein